MHAHTPVVVGSPLVDPSHVSVDVSDVVFRRKELVEVADGGVELIGEQ